MRLTTAFVLNLLPLTSLAFFSRILSRGSSAQVGGHRGVGPDAALKVSEKYYVCDGRNIPIERLNDNYCDCIDESDEPGTSACNKGSFTCLNPGYKRSTIPSSRVDDRICDCCDGSDEQGICEDTCDAAAAAERKLLEARKLAYIANINSIKIEI